MPEPTEETAQATEPGAKKGKKRRDEAAAGEAAQPRVVAPVPPKHRAQPSVGAEVGGDVFLDTAGKSIDTLRDNWQVIAAGLLVTIVAVVFITFRVESGKTREREAWNQYRALDEKDAPAPGPDEWLAKADESRGTSAEPYFQLRAADLLCADGSPEKLEKARGYYDSIAKSFSGNSVVATLAQKGLDAVKDATTFDPAKAMGDKPKVEMAKDLPPLPQTATPAATTATASPSK